LQGFVAFLQQGFAPLGAAFAHLHCLPHFLSHFGPQAQVFVLLAFFTVAVCSALAGAAFFCGAAAEAVPNAITPIRARPNKYFFIIFTFYVYN
jgi:hypothetical protein